jgi:hypothetical protein
MLRSTTVVGAILAVAVGALACAPAVRHLAEEAAPAAVGEGLEELAEPENLAQIAGILTDPQIQDAAAELAGSMAGGAAQALADPALEPGREELERVAAGVMRASFRGAAEGFEHELGPAMQRFLLDEFGPSLAATVDQQVAAAVAGTVSREMARQAVFGADEALAALRAAHAADEHYRPLGRAQEVAGVGVWLVPVMIALCAAIVVLAILLGWTIVRARRREAALTRALESAEGQEALGDHARAH